jgi:hypothetical protein
VYWHIHSDGALAHQGACRLQLQAALLVGPGAKARLLMSHAEQPVRSLTLRTPKSFNPEPRPPAGEDTFSDLDDGELDGFLLSREEAQLKEQVRSSGFRV